MTETLADDVRSFITFALAMKPTVVVNRRADAGGPSMTLTLSPTPAAAGKGAARAGLAELEPLMEKYRPLRPYLVGITEADGGAVTDPGAVVATCEPTTYFKPGVDYRLVRIPAEQYRAARELATRLDRIHVLDEANYTAEAVKEYEALQEYLKERRTTLVGEFEDITFTDPVPAYGADRLAAADNDCGGLVIFIVIEIFIA